MESASNKCSQPECIKPAKWKGLCIGCYNRIKHQERSQKTQNFIGEMSTEDLLNFVESNDNKKDPKMEEAYRFVIAHNIKQGDYKVSTVLLFNLYKKWTKTPTTRKNFFFYLAKLFKRSQTKKASNGYYMNIEPFSELVETGKAIISGKTIYAKEEFKKDKKITTKIPHATKKIQQ